MNATTDYKARARADAVGELDVDAVASIAASYEAAFAELAEPEPEMTPEEFRVCLETQAPGLQVCVRRGTCYLYVACPPAMQDDFAPWEACVYPAYARRREHQAGTLRELAEAILAAQRAEGGAG